MIQTLSQTSTDEIFASVLNTASNNFNKDYPGELPARQPVHTVYGGAQIFKVDTVEKLGQSALHTFQDYAENFAILAHAIKIPNYEQIPVSNSWIQNFVKAIEIEKNRILIKQSQPAAYLAYTVHERVIKKLRTEAVEDFRIDFEDGYGSRPDSEEDMHAKEAAEAVLEAMKLKKLPPYIGIRIKPFTDELRQRSVRTLDIFLSTLCKEKQLPNNFVVTLPKVCIPEQVTAFIRILELLEKNLNLAKGTFKIELMIETTQSIFDSDGKINILSLVKAAEGRCVACHFGTYDYTASCNITASEQRMDHLSCDFARQVMKVALAGTGIWLSDGATNVMPVGPHRQSKNNSILNFQQQQENTQIVHNAWRLSYQHISHSLVNGFYQGWDLHPAQLPIRYAAYYTFFLQGLEAASVRLRSFMDKAAQATLVGDVFDDAATGQGLLNYFLRALNCGAVTEEELRETGLSLEEIRCRSFVKILNTRRQKETSRRA